MFNGLLDLGIEGRVAIITGAGRGVGRATARVFAAAGAKVVAVDIDADELNNTMSQLPNNPDLHLPLVKDLARVEECEDVVRVTESTYGRLDILVNIAAIILRIPLDRVDETSWQRIHDVNLKSQFFLARAAVEVMKKAKYGRIINFSSQGAHSGGFDNSIVYNTFKGAVLTLTRGLARQYAADGICVNTIAPGPVDTRMMANLPPERLQEFLNLVPLKRMAEPEEIALCALFLASKWASYITGAVLDVNGGLYMR
ncbi:SDR family NAD(P)-dependent oxidoreductase [Neomoorella mulderi]|uniref:Bile acid 7-dehydroxylase 1/3 n=1 Tax=Moorella mulderi DSM 14980 TaxID=1122241 RepID=A0A151AYJ7_9FIRM|nr:SDR family oxidoreductase [Moorella mulderi]KYH32725.1 bile acid 7-dehydroxylase 1/3 [Moorella mulderi DSM 14980]